MNKSALQAPIRCNKNAILNEIVTMYDHQLRGVDYFVHYLFDVKKLFAGVA